MIGSDQLREVLAAVGQLLEAKGKTVRIVIVGGASLNLAGLVDRATDDVDVIARAEEDEGGPILIPPDPMPDALMAAVQRVARDFGLPSGWLNTAVANQWETSLPPSLKENLTWHRFGGLRVGVAGRRPLIALKLLAAVDQGGPQSVHYQDLVRLNPTEEELEEARGWATSEDPSPIVADHIDQVIRHVRDDIE
ncbi:DUF6036 family nucleotidyltransferase [Salinibacter ruber]|uniref:DUF6036 family nucleotidyltransferase n=1 Tax=Salinibacter ruber TaxID=146919 RepID=UPI00216862EB|nr:DUF6036 family nucleotidyltransferase [Salinibacter ruber]MCS3856574.1 hypothetical protein [Salinibacter ruber]MCS4054579.1 hypothetical protein [Salinibacter ruber]MCS4149486.1 hypothetical protein [Salinibacter ruber]